jgi:hypothetical protein
VAYRAGHAHADASQGAIVPMRKPTVSRPTITVPSRKR